MSLKPDALSKAPQFLSAPFLDTIFYFRSAAYPFFCRRYHHHLFLTPSKTKQQFSKMCGDIGSTSRGCMAYSIVGAMFTVSWRNQ
jgi:hypothetical protein